MKIHEALRRIEEIYIPGCVAYYESLERDLWQEAHNEFESGLGSGNDSVAEMLCDNFVKKIEQLVLNYKKQKLNISTLTHKDAFYLQDVDKLKKWESIVYKYCFKCMGKKSLSARTTKTEPPLAYLICDKCEDTPYE